MEEITIVLYGEDRERALQLAQNMGRPIDEIVAGLVEHALALRTPPGEDRTVFAVPV